jgi:pimeloyl-ACP methyl ester carboxylesterase
VFQKKAPLSDQFIDSSDTRLRYVEAGEGEAVLLLHGFLGDIETSWIGVPYGPKNEILPPLARRFRTIAMDSRGHGKSDKPHDPARYGACLADDVVALLDHLGIERAHLVGYSMGSLVAGKVVCERPDRLGKVVFGGGMPYAASLFPGGKAPEDDALADELAAGRGIVKYLLASTPEGHPGMTPAQAAEISHYVLRGKDIAALVACGRAMSGLGVTDAQLAANRVPALGLIGTLDDGLSHLSQVAQRMPGLTIELIEGGDHVTTPAHPKFLRAIERFLSGPSPSGNP